MREIKFRVWHVEDKLMEFPVGPVVDSLVIDLNGRLLQLIDEDMVHDTSKTARVVLPDDIILMQFTGLKDKNGKEIYEGDIVKYTYTDGWPAHIWNEDYAHRDPDGTEMVDEVKFEDGAFVFFSKEVPDNYVFAIRHAKYCIIIGNIYENSELLKS